MDEQERRRFAANHLLGFDERQELFARFWRDWQPRLLVYLGSFTALSREDVEELASDCLLRAFERAASYQAERPLGPWLYTLARRQACNRLRRQRGERCSERHGEGSTEQLLVSGYREAEEELLRLDDQASVAGFLRGCTALERQLIYLVYAENYSLQAAAAVLGQPRGTLKWRLYRVRQRLKAQLETIYG